MNILLSYKVYESLLAKAFREFKHLASFVAQRYEGLSLFAVIFCFVFPGQPTQSLIDNLPFFLQDFRPPRDEEISMVHQSLSSGSC